MIGTRPQLGVPFAMVLRNLCSPVCSAGHCPVYRTPHSLACLRLQLSPIACCTLPAASLLCTQFPARPRSSSVTYGFAHPSGMRSHALPHAWIRSLSRFGTAACSVDRKQPCPQLSCGKAELGKKGRNHRRGRDLGAGRPRPAALVSACTCNAGGIPLRTVPLKTEFNAGRPWRGAVKSFSVPPPAPSAVPSQASHVKRT